MKTIDKVILKDGKTYDFSPNKKRIIFNIFRK